MVRLAGRRAIVTGAARGIGQAVVKLFAEEGACVAAMDLRAMAGPPSGLSLVVDLRDPDAVVTTMEAAIESLGGLDILVNCAASVTEGATAEDLPLSAWAEAIDVNLTAPFLTCRAAIPAMRAGGGGAIVNVSSVFGRRPAPEAVAYCATKGGLVQLTRALARDHARDGIRVNILSPGAVRTERLVDLYGSMAAGDAALAPAHPVGRIADPMEIAEAALHLASDASGFVTGTDLVIDGGFSLR